jgi:hypothetical protein
MIYGLMSCCAAKMATVKEKEKYKNMQALGAITP